MPVQKGRDFLIKIGDGQPSESFTTIGAARTNALVVNNNPVDATTMNSGGVQAMIADAGTQTMQLTIDGIFKDDDAEETLRAAAFDRAAANFKLLFPNGDEYAASFVVQDYHRRGDYDGLESFTATLIRTGAGAFTPGA